MCGFRIGPLACRNREAIIDRAEEQGCELRQRIMNGPRGDVVTRYLVRGKLVAILPDIEDDERLAPTVITQLVRVLGLTGFDHCIIGDDEPLAPDTDHMGPIP